MLFLTKADYIKKLTALDKENERLQKELDRIGKQKHEIKQHTETLKQMYLRANQEFCEGDFIHIVYKNGRKSLGKVTFCSVNELAEIVYTVSRKTNTGWVYVSSDEIEKLQKTVLG